jgi:MHS family proline/betaine transporter-like MFS transporter
LVIAAFSTIVEWYDFTLYVYFATVLARVFYGGGADSIALTLGSFAVAYLMRPVGALIFGHVGDRHGRRRMLLWSVALMTAAMLATALLPTERHIGAAAGWLLFLLRCVMGFSVGGEYSGVVAYLLEAAPSNRRGLIASLASAASEIGALLAVGVSALTVSMLSEAELTSWGWRIPFLFGALLAGGVWIARSTMQESPEFERQVAAGSVPESPWRHTLANHKIGIARAFAISALGSITYYVGITYVPAFLTSTGALGEADSLWLATAAAIAVIVVTPLTGLLSDRVGRKPVLLSVCLLSALLPATLFSVMGGGSYLQAVLAAIVLAAVAGAMSAVGAVATAEQFPGEGRVTGLAVGATGATAIFGGLTPYLAERWVQGTGQIAAPGIMIAIVALVVMPVLFFMKETAPSTRGRDPGEPLR